jgi:hypothetical protein
MDEATKSNWSNIWGRPRRFFLWATLFSVFGWFASGFILEHVHRESNWSNKYFIIPVLFFAFSVLALVGLTLSAIPRTRGWMSWVLRRGVFCGAALVTLIALFYAEENWRGQRALDRAKQEQAAKGIVLDWDKYIPPAVPDDQNVFKAPKMQEWFVKMGRQSTSNELTAMLQAPKNFPIWGTRNIESEAEARAYIAWSDTLQPQFNMIRDSLKRPYSRMDGDYANLSTLPIPNFVAIREMARVLAQRTHCYLVLQEPDKAVAEMALMHDLSHLMDSKPTGKPITLVAAMINVAVIGLYTEVIGQGLQTHAWKEPQLVELQRQLSEIHAMIPVAEAFQSEPAASARELETLPTSEILDFFPGPGHTYERILFGVAPRGWVLQNVANEMPFRYGPGDAMDIEHERVSPGILKDNQARLEKFVSRSTPFGILTALAVPNFQKAVQTMARNQTFADEALIVCGLERYRLANGSYPDSLDALVPKFIDQLPHDIITGEPLKYRHAGDSFVLYSLGWNEKDDGGVEAAPFKDQRNLTDGDWVWIFMPK